MAKGRHHAGSSTVRDPTGLDVGRERGGNADRADGESIDQFGGVVSRDPVSLLTSKCPDCTYIGIQRVPDLSIAMMPWEHLFVGYICYSMFVHAVVRGSPTSGETLTLGLASVLPDLIDKPLAWEFGVFSSGYAIAHSIFFALSVSVAVGWLAASRGRPRIGWAFAAGYVLHPAADVVSKYLRDGELRLDRLLWPLRRSGDGYEAGFTGEFTVNVFDYVVWVGRQVATGDLDTYAFLLLGIGVFGVSLWVYDGMPVGREASSAVRRAVRAIARAV